MTKNKPWIVLKFGGTSVSQAKNWGTITRIICEKLKNNYRIVVVHSALSGITDQLETLIHQAKTGNYHQEYDAIVTLHQQLINQLNLPDQHVLNVDFDELHRLADGIHLLKESTLSSQAKVLAMGELMATRLSFHYLKQQLDSYKVVWQDARNILTSRESAEIELRHHFLNAYCDYDVEEQLANSLAKKGDVIVTQGFIAQNIKQQTVLLGRGGSDTSAAYIAAKLQAKTLEIWTDVPGLFSANPHLIKNARLLKQIGYREAQEIASTGAKVLHPRCIRPARKYQIPIRIGYTSKPELEGTTITRTEAQAGRVKAISIRKSITLVTMETVGMWQQVGFLADAFRCFKEEEISVDLVSTSESNITVSLDAKANNIDESNLNALLEKLNQFCRAKLIPSCAAISLVGNNMRTTLSQIAPALEIFKEKKVYMLCQAANDLNFTIVVENREAEKLTKQLHELLIKHQINDEVLGNTWENIYQQKKSTVNIKPIWWQQSKENLIEIAKKSPIYVYSEYSLKQAISKLKTVDQVDQVFYAMKANANEQILKLFVSQGLGIECVSLNEMNKLFALAQNIDPKRILFTPNFVNKEEYQYAFTKNVHVTLDGLYPLENWPEVFTNQEILARIDLGYGRGHHKYVQTAGDQAKFGIPVADLDRLRRLSDKHNIKIIGLHSHAGSGILDASYWKDTATQLAQIAEKFPNISYLNIGGGLGVPMTSSDTELNIIAFNQGLQEVKAAFPQYQLWLEPGRYLVAKSGVLLTTVTQIKYKGNQCYIGINTGINSLIRPALYGAYHEIVNLSKLHEEPTQIATVVGPICETGDQLGVERLLPITEAGDVILIADVGAYGSVMSSHYNLREPAQELYFSN